MEMKQTLYIFIFVLIFAIFPGETVASQFDSFLPDELDFDIIFSDIPPEFDFSTATIFSFKKLPYITEESAMKLISLRDSLSYGYIMNNYDEIDGLSPMEYAVLRQLSTHKQQSSISDLSGSLRQGYIHNPQTEDISDSKYYLKAALSTSENLRITCIGERDANEQRAFDLFSANVSASFDENRIKVILGDYRHGFGQGLLYSRYGRNFGDGTGIMLRDVSRVENTSFDESYYLRGSYISINRKWITSQVWYSLRKLDATLNETGNAVTLRDSGYHFTDSNRNNLKEQILGTRFKTNPLDGLSCAIAAALSYYSPSLAQKDGEPYFHDLIGSTFHHISFDGTFQKGASTFFIEHVREGTDDHASISGLNIKKGTIKTTVAFRYFSEGYWAPRSGGFNTFGENSNEKGVYSSLQTNLPHKTQLNVSCDLARTLYRRASTLLPDSQQRINVVLRKSITKKYNTWIGYRTADKYEKDMRRWNCRLGMEKKHWINNKMRLQSHIAWSEAKDDGGPYYESAIDINGSNLWWEFIGGVFDIPSYDSRYYRYEDNLPGRGYTLPVWGRGGLFIIVAGYGPLSVRYRYCDSDMMDFSQQMAMQLDIIF
ncbi:MAG: hypothetical protein JXB48_01395 [Candidatus Latescibacteria bacterium]|nr:hypothetical protein [Candidatus Latescibacterota bacterium]